MAQTITASSIKSLPENVGQQVIYRDGLLALFRSPVLYIDGRAYGFCKHGKYTTVNLRPGTYRLNVGVENVVVDVRDGEQTFVKCGVWRSILESNDFGFVDAIKPVVGLKEVSSLDLLSSFDVYQ